MASPFSRNAFRTVPIISYNSKVLLNLSLTQVRYQAHTRSTSILVFLAITSSTLPRMDFSSCLRISTNLTHSTRTTFKHIISIHHSQFKPAVSMESQWALRMWCRIRSSATITSTFWCKMSSSRPSKRPTRLTMRESLIRRILKRRIFQEKLDNRRGRRSMVQAERVSASRNEIRLSTKS